MRDNFDNIDNYLLNNNFSANSKINNLKLLEIKLKKYTELALIRENIKISSIKPLNLECLLEEVNKTVSENDKDNYFDSYNKYIIEAISKIDNQPKIPIIKIELDKDILIIEKNGKLKAIFVNELLEPYKVPAIIINEYHKILEKNPTNN